MLTLLSVIALLCVPNQAEARHIWQKFMGGGGLQGGGGGPAGRPPSISPTTFQLLLPTVVSGIGVGVVTASNPPITKCELTAGNTNGFYTTQVHGATVDTHTGCNIGVSQAGVNNLTTTHVDVVHLKATNAFGTGENDITISNVAKPTLPATSFQVTPPVGAAQLGIIQTGNIPQTIALGNCGSCAGFFLMSLNAANGQITFSTSSAASGIQPGQTYTQNYTATNAAGTTNGTVVVAAINNLPVAQPATCNVAHADLALNNTVCTVTGTNNPTAFHIASCAPNCAANFDVSTTIASGGSSGSIFFKSLTGIAAGATYTLQVTASNQVGTGPAAAVSIIVGPDLTPVLASGTFPIPFDNITDNFDVAQVAVTNGVSVDHWSLGGCTIGGGGSCAGFFSIDDAPAPTAGHIRVVAASNISRSTTYDVVAQATNGDGTGAATQHITVDNGNISPPVVGSTSCLVSVPVLEGDRPCAGIPATNPPVTYSISGCGGYFDIDPAGGEYIVTAAGAAAADLNSTTVPFTCHPVVSASNPGGSGQANQTISSVSDGSSGSTCDTLQLPNLFATGTGLVAFQYLSGGIPSNSNTLYVMNGGTLNPNPPPATNPNAGVGICAVSGQTPVCLYILNQGNYTAIPTNPVSLRCTHSCGQNGSTPLVGNAQWFCPHG